MPWQLFGNGRSDWSTKLTRGLEAEAAAGFQSRRGRCREPTPVTPQYATFQTYKAARVHHASRRRGRGMAARGALTTARPNEVHWCALRHYRRPDYARALRCVSSRVKGTRLDRWSQHSP